jgi:haloacetate dehalogenase
MPDLADLFPGYASEWINTSSGRIFARVGGEGPPLLLLHGFSSTHVMWHRVAPQLADRFTLIIADLPGYGWSDMPESDQDHTPYTKRAMAKVMVEAMEQLGHVHFALAGHDRGGRVAYRMAFDHPQRVERLAVLDIVPTGEAWRRADARLALGYWPWSLLAQPVPLPERLIAADPQAVVDNALDGWGSQPASFPDDVRATYIDALSDPRSVHAICEEYRAAATIDIAKDEADRTAGNRISCPTLVLWSENGALDTWYSDAGGPLAIWRGWASEATGRAVAGGHFFPEQNPAETIAELRAFFGGR